MGIARALKVKLQNVCRHADDKIIALRKIAAALC
jgi:hypothetical protein